MSPRFARRLGDAILIRSLNGLKRRYRQDGRATIGDLVGSLHGEGSATAIALLAMPFLWPLSLGPIATAISVVIGFWAWKMLPHDRAGESALANSRLGRGLHSAQQRFLAVPLPQRAYKVMCKVLMFVLRVKKVFARPRLGGLVEGERGRVVAAYGMLVGALLLMVPIPLIPLTNFFPAVGIILFSFGWTERDGLLTVLGSFVHVVAAAYLLFIAALILIFGAEAFSLINGWFAEITGLRFLSPAAPLP